jgi:ESCRT-II complex subunit
VVFTLLKPFFPFLFSLQTVKETREKQVQLWKDLILDFCRNQKIFIISLEEDLPIFSNPVIESMYFDQYILKINYSFLLLVEPRLYSGICYLLF